MVNFPLDASKSSNPLKYGYKQVKSLMSKDSIQINLKLFSIYQEVLGTTELHSSFPVGITVGQVLDILIEQHPQLAQWRLITRLGVNLQFVEPTEVLADGDEVVFIPPVSGG
jgi:sulfur-carrier protein